METHQQMVADKLTVGQLMTTNLLALPPLVPVRQLISTLRAASHHSFPVTKEVETAMRSEDDFELEVCWKFICVHEMVYRVYELPIYRATFFIHICYATSTV